MKFFNFTKGGTEKLILILIFILAVFLRLYKLEEVPPGFHIDEVTVGYNAYSLIETGRDENGNFLPLYIDSFGDFRPAGYFYLTAPFIKIFGLNEFSVRFPSAIFGALTIVLLFFLAKQIFRNNLIALLSSFLLAISPWHLIVSRASSETSVALFLIVTGVYLFLVGSEKKKILYLIFSLTLLFISFYMYHTPRIFVPLLLLVLIGLNWRKFENVKKITIGFSIVILIASIVIALFGSGQGRFNQVSIFASPGVYLRLTEQIREEPVGTNIFLVRVLHNKIVNYSLETLSNYGKHFSTDFLFIKGGLPTRYTVPEIGLIYLIEAPFLILGLLLILREKNKPALLPVFWLLAGPVAASLTFEDIPNIQRAFFMLPSFQIITAYGIYTVFRFKKKGFAKNALISLLGAFLIFNFIYFLHQYFVHQRVYRPWYRNYGFKELVNTINNLAQNYQKIILTKDQNDPYIYILFYNKYDPQVYQQQYSHLRSKEEWGFEKYLFNPAKCPSQIKDEVLKDQNTLFIDKGECGLKPYAKILQTIYREDKTPAFRLVTVDRSLAADYFKKQESKLE